MSSEGRHEIEAARNRLAAARAQASSAAKNLELAKATMKHAESMLQTSTEEVGAAEWEAAAEAMLQWTDHLHEGKRMRVILSRSILRLQNRCVDAAMRRWAYNVAEEKHLKHKALKVVQRLLNRIFVEGFEQWRVIVEEHKVVRAEEGRKEAVMRKIVLRMTHRAAAEAMKAVATHTEVVNARPRYGGAYPLKVLKGTKTNMEY